MEAKSCSSFTAPKGKKLESVRYVLLDIQLLYHVMLATDQEPLGCSLLFVVQWSLSGQVYSLSSSIRIYEFRGDIRKHDCVKF